MSVSLLSQSLAQGLLEGAVYGLLSLSLALILSVTKLLNFAHGAILMSAMYVVLFLSRHGVPIYLTALIVVPLYLGVGMVAYYGLFRRIEDSRFLMQAQLTLGLLLLIEGGAIMVETVDVQRPDNAVLAGQSVAIGQVSISVPQLVAALVAIVVSIGVHLMLQRTNLGRQLRALSQDRLGATLVGINTARMYALTWGIGLAVLGIAASTIMMSSPVQPYVGHHYTIVMLLAVVVGGIGDLAGTFVGAMIIGVSYAFGQTLLGGDLALVPAYLIVFGMILMRPKGLLNRGAEL